MTLTTALLVVLLGLGVVYVLVPLFRDEDELEGFDRVFPGTRTLHGPNMEEAHEPREAALDDDVVRCSNCGAVVETEYSYCSECLAKVR
jgi:hypothetical protein